MENLAMKYTVMTVFQFDPPFVDNPLWTSTFKCFICLLTSFKM